MSKTLFFFFCFGGGGGGGGGGEHVLKKKRIVQEMDFPGEFIEGINLKRTALFLAPQFQCH
jgi:hypothetical protein